MEKRLLTLGESKIFDQLQQYPGGKLKKHQKGLSSTVAYRLYDSKMNPVANLPVNKVNALKDKGVLVMEGIEFTLKPVA